MGLIICKKHGQQGIAINIQEEVCRTILANEPLKDEDLSVIKAIFYDNEEFLMDINYIVTVAFKEKLKLKTLYEIRTEEEDRLWLASISAKMGIVCGQCLNEYKFRKEIDGTLQAYRTYVHL